MMQLSKARFRIFFIWLCAFVVYVLMFELAPWARGSDLISRSDAHGGCLKILSLVVPVLSAYSAFWWYRDGSKRGTVSKERWHAALAVTVVFHVVLFILLLDVVYFESYKTTSVTGAASFPELVANVLQLGLLFSPVAIAPVAHFLGVEPSEITVGPPEPAASKET